MRILVMGAGGVGGYFGAKLVQAGRDVTFLVRPARAQSLTTNGLRVRPLKGDEFTLDVHVLTAAELAAQAPATPAAANRPAATPAAAAAPPAQSTATAAPGFDLVLFAVKSYGVEQALADVAPAIGPETVIVPTLNGMRHVDRLRERFGASAVAGGVCIVAAQVDDDGAIRQVGPGGALSYGEFDGSVTTRMLGVDAALSDAGFRASLSTTIELDMWEKWMLLAAGGALTTLFHSPVGPIVAAPGGLDAARAIVNETVAVATAAGFAPRDEALDRITRTLTEPGSTFTTSMYRDQSQGRDVEADQIVGDLVARGRALGVSVPTLALASTALGVYEESRRAG